MIKIENNKNCKYLVISVFVLPDNDELIKRSFAYWHTRMEHRRRIKIPDQWSRITDHGSRSQAFIGISRSLRRSSIRQFAFPVPNAIETPTPFHLERDINQNKFVTKSKSQIASQAMDTESSLTRIYPHTVSEQNSIGRKIIL